MCGKEVMGGGVSSLGSTKVHLIHIMTSIKKYYSRISSSLKSYIACCDDHKTT